MLCGSLRTDVSEELSASFIRVKRIGELGTRLAVTSNLCMLRRYTVTCHPDEGGAKFVAYNSYELDERNE
jgi:hypothetical protein